jgi:hypothetical protein
MQTSARLTTVVLPDLALDITHASDLGRFNTNVKATAGSDKITSETAWVMAGDFDLIQTLSSYLKGESNTATLTLSKVTSGSEITAMISGNINAQKAKVVSKLNKLYNDVTGSVEVMTPFRGYEQMGAAFQVRKFNVQTLIEF